MKELLKLRVFSLIKYIDKKIELLEAIPKSFDPRQDPVGIDLDLYTDIVSQFKDDLNTDFEEFEIYFTHVDRTLSRLLEVFYSEILGVRILKNFNSSGLKDFCEQNKIESFIRSVDKIIFTDFNGLNTFISKSETLGVNIDSIFKIPIDEIEQYDVFINLYKSFIDENEKKSLESSQENTDTRSDQLVNELIKFKSNEEFILVHYSDSGHDNDTSYIGFQNALDGLQQRMSDYETFSGGSFGSLMSEPVLSHPSGDGRIWDFWNEKWE